jgi:uncharacterized protein YbjT (DUF2867 family)
MQELKRTSPTVMVLGGYGLIGAATVRRLSAAGLRVLGVGRDTTEAERRYPKVQWLQMDIARPGAEMDVGAIVSGVDIVVNAAGVLQDGPRDNVRELQALGMQRLFAACAAKGIRIINISAAGVETSTVPFMATKHETDQQLGELDVDWVVLRPGLVLSPVAFGGSGLLRGLAGMPLFLFSAENDRSIRAVHVDDVAEAVLACINGQVPPRRAYDLVSDDATTLETLLVSMRSWLGFPPAIIIRLPIAATRMLFTLGDLAGQLGWRPPVRTAAFDQLALGIQGNPEDWRRASGAGLGTVRDILDRIPVGAQEKWFARLWLLKPAIVVALAAFWFLSGLVGIIQADKAAEVLTSRGTSAAIALTAVYGGAALDILIGFGIAWRRTTALALKGSLLVSLGYLAGATLLAADLWIDPLGPLVKIIPAMVMSLVALAILEDR